MAVFVPRSWCSDRPRLLVRGAAILRERRQPPPSRSAPLPPIALPHDIAAHQADGEATPISAARKVRAVHSASREHPAGRVLASPNVGDADGARRPSAIAGFCPNEKLGHVIAASYLRRPWVRVIVYLFLARWMSIQPTQSPEAEDDNAGLITDLEEGSVLTERHASITGLPAHTRAAITGAMIETD